MIGAISWCTLIDYIIPSLSLSPFPFPFLRSFPFLRIDIIDPILFISFSPESVSRAMPSSELSYDAYRFHRSNDYDPMGHNRPKNIAKVEPYSINTTNNRSQPATTTTAMTQNFVSTPPPNQARSFLNSMGTTSTNSSSSTSSLLGMNRHANVLQSDFLVPHRAHSPRFVAPPPPPVPPAISQPSYPPAQPSSPSSILFLSESVPHSSLHSLAVANHSLSHTPTARLLSSNKNSTEKSRSLTPRDFYSHSVRTIAFALFCPSFLAS